MNVTVLLLPPPPFYVRLSFLQISLLFISFGLRAVRSLDPKHTKIADQTRLKEIQEAQKKTDIMFMDESARSVEQLQQYNGYKFILGEGQTASVEKGSTLVAAVHNSFRQEGSNVSRQEHNNHQNAGTYSALNKMEFPYFDGENARGWVRRCTRPKLPMASIYMQGKVELWYQCYTEKKEFRSWDELVINILERFENLDSERVMLEFNKLHYETILNTYLKRFEELKDQMLIFIRNLEEEFFIMKFISRLKGEVKSFVSTCNPTSLKQVVILARKQEHTVNAILKRAPQPSRNTQTKPPFRPQNKNPPHRTNTQVKRFLTEAKVRAKKEKNLCYRCDEPYVPGHSDEEARDFDEAEQDEQPVDEAEGDITVQNATLVADRPIEEAHLDHVINGAPIILELSRQKETWTTEDAHVWYRNGVAVFWSPCDEDDPPIAS
ncbi:UNVERIFIED_CONTAM: hypothetical protein Sindi_2864900 [Sesamum indicum]